MSTIIDVPGNARVERRLPLGAFAEVAFVPVPGMVSAFAAVAKKVPGKIPPKHEDEDPLDPGLIDAGRLDVSIRAPTGKVMASGPGLQEIHFDVPSSLAGKTWRARVVNRAPAEVLAVLLAGFVKSRHRSVTTPLAQRVLNHGLQTALDVLGITVKIDGGNSVVAFSRELEQLSGIALPRMKFDAKIARDINLQTIGITARRAASGRPMLKVCLEFETGGVEIGVGFLDLADITSASIEIEIELETRGRAGAVVPRFKVKSNIGATLTQAGGVASIALFVVGGITGGPKTSAS